jgi:alpha-pyrone synthase
MNVGIIGIGTATPASALTQDQALQLNISRTSAGPRQARILERLYGRSGVRKRASVLENDGSVTEFYPEASPTQPHGPSVAERMERYAREAPVLATAAARRCLRAAGVDPDEVSQVVTVSCTGFSAPGVDTALIRSLELRPGVGRTAIGYMGCHGAINGLRVAGALAKAEPGSSVLLVAVELCSLHFHYGSDGDKLVANSLFADGAGAALLRAGDSDDGALRLQATGSTLIPDSEKEMGWLVGNHGFEMSLSTRVPGVLRDQLKGWLVNWLSSSSVALSDIGSWAVHPGGPRILDATQQALGLTDDAMRASREVLANHGNMSSPTVLFVLEELKRSDSRMPCLLLAFGPGLVIEAALLA